MVDAFGRYMSVGQKVVTSSPFYGIRVGRITKIKETIDCGGGTGATVQLQAIGLNKPQKHIIRKSKMIAVLPED